jgi:S1-C subfamily serine protease
MELEQLTKSQTVLLTLLVSFVTSIATGIVTVSLLDQAPPAVTQTINRVVERTIETVTPSQTQNASVITKETTVVVKEEDLITSSIENNLTSLVTLYQGTTTNSVSGYGVIISKEGAVVADAGAIVGEGTYLVTSGGTVLYEVRVAKRDVAHGLVFFTPVSGVVVPSVSPVQLGASQNVKLGQTVLALGSTSRANVNSGIVSSVDTTAIGVPPQDTVLISASISGKIPPPGSPLLNMFGDVIGISTSVSRAIGDHVYVPADPVALFLKEWPENLVQQTAENSTQ